ncbi:MAG: hypothetical protein A2293_15720 [Elusimicrobia bacterium RIFOXYB2_FULL_49_7]|nr:MAG: hypothetical protein A2293_15720 [Elusimicrobia bacterium RIFOXYB2_FULL_49_7]
MKILTRYLIKEFMKPLVFSSVAFGGLVLISEFFRELNFYMEKKAAFSAVFQYLFLNLPWWVIQVLPVAVLLAVLFSLGQLAKQGEITAIKASGINLWRIVSVLFLCGLFLGAVEVVLREKIIPYTVEKAEYVRKEKIEKQPVFVRTEYNDLVIALPAQGRMTVGILNVKENLMRDVVIDYYDESFGLSRQIVVREVRWSQGTEWVFLNGVERVFAAGTWQDSYFSEKMLSLPFEPKDFMITQIRPEQLSSAEYKKHIQQLTTLGIPTERETIKFYGRWSSVFSHLIVMLIGIPFALGLGSRHGKVISFTFALLFAFFYWGVQAVGQSLGENHVVTPLLAAWLGNIIFGVLGVGLLNRIGR